MAICFLFVVLTTIAMLFYPGGTHTDSSTCGYLFFQNFFSDLGRTRAWSGESNTVSAILFIMALVLAGAGLALFFVSFAQFFNRTSASRLLSIFGSITGVISGICFVGVAATPSDLYLGTHRLFVEWAFRMFLLAVVLYIAAIMVDRQYPRRLALVFVVFAILLAAYVVLLTIGPSLETTSGLKIQVAGQKIIVYAAIISVFIQGFGALRYARSKTLPRS